MRKRILIKLSGAALKDKKTGETFSSQKLISLAKQIIQLHNTYDIAIVIGGGNIWRGNMYNKNICKEMTAHYMGMVATIINALYLSEAIKKYKGNCEVLSLLPCPVCCQTYTPSLAINLLDKKKILILAGGTGKPFFSTDTGASKCAHEIKANSILMAKDGVDGVFSSDPKKNKKASRYSQLNMTECIKKKMQFMDISAMKMCLSHKISVWVFNIERKNAIIQSLNQKIPVTLIHPF